MARNRAAEAARYPLLAFLDADDEWLPGCLRAHLECRRVRPAVGVTLSPCRILVDGKPDREERIVDRALELEAEGGFFYATRFQTGLVQGVAASSICVDRELFLGVGGFDSQLHCREIADLLYRLLLENPAVGVLPELATVIHGSYTEGQWARTHEHLGQRIRWSHKILDRIDAVPRDQRSAMLATVHGCLRSALAAAEAEQFRCLSRRIGPAAGGDWKLVALRAAGRLPDRAILVAAWLYRAVHALRARGAR